MNLAEFPPLELAAPLWFAALVLLYEVIARLPSVSEHSISAFIQKQRRGWMLRMSERDNRIVDGQLLGWLVNANAFFASTSVIAIGGVSALLGYGDQARQIVQSLPYSTTVSPALWEMKVIFLILMLIFAFIKFAWAFRLSHYTVIMMGATPAHDSADANQRRDHARRTADLLGLVGHHSNQGLRAFYYTIAGMMWFFHPLAFMAAATWVVVMLIRRDFYSKSRALIGGDHSSDECQ